MPVIRICTGCYRPLVPNTVCQGCGKPHGEAARKARKKASGRNRYAWGKLVQQVIARDGACMCRRDCAWHRGSICGEKNDLTGHHLVPTSQPSMANVVTACRRCNSAEAGARGALMTTARLFDRPS